MKTQTTRGRAVRISIACALFLLSADSLASAPAVADGNGSDVVVVATGDSAPVAEVDPAAVSRSPLELLRLEIDGILSAGRDRVATLEAELVVAEDLEAVLDLHRAIERAKIQTELELFQAQLVFAEKTGREQLAAALRDAVQQLAARNGLETEDAAQPAASER